MAYFNGGPSNSFGGNTQNPGNGNGNFGQNGNINGMYGGNMPYPAGFNQSTPGTNGWMGNNPTTPNNQYSIPFASQNTQTPPQTNSIPGRTINIPNDIAPNEIPMDGHFSFFPTSDMSAVYAKAWLNNGTITTIKFVPEIVSQGANVQPEPSEFEQKTMDALEEIKMMLSNKNRPNNKPYEPKPKTEVKE